MLGFMVFHVLSFQLKKNIVELINKNYEVQISIDKLHLWLPNKFQLIDTLLSYHNSEAQESIISIPKIDVTISGSKIFTERRLSLSKIHIPKLSLDHKNSSLEMDVLISKVITLLGQLSDHDISIQLSDARIHSSQLTGEGHSLSSDIMLFTKGGRISSYGSFRKVPIQDSVVDEKVAAKQDVFEYRLKGHPSLRGFKIENLQLSSPNFLSNFRGYYTDDVLALNGYYWNYNSDGRGRQLDAREDRPASDIEYHLLDIESRIRIESNTLKFEKLAFTFNNLPTQWKGEIVLEEFLKFDVEGVMEFRSEDEHFLKNLSTSTLQMQGSFDNPRLKAQAQLILNLNPNVAEKVGYKEIKVDLKDFMTDLTTYPLKEIQVDQMIISWLTPLGYYQLPVQSFKAEFQPSTSEETSLNISGSLLEAVRNPEISNGELKFQIVGNIDGLFNGQIRLRTDPDYTLEGELDISNGNLNDTEYLRWLSEYFDLQRLEHISFQSLSLHFTLSPQETNLSEILLQSRDVNFSGNLKIDGNKFISSRLSINIEKELMNESAVFRPLLRWLPEDFNPMEFDLQLSGNMETISIQWLPSELRNSVQEHIPRTWQYRIERRIEGDMKNSKQLSRSVE